MEDICQKYWEELSIDDKLKLLENYNFWDGFSHYKYEYLPMDLKTLIWVKIEENNLKKESLK